MLCLLYPTKNCLTQAPTMQLLSFMQDLQASIQHVRAHHRLSAVSFSCIASFGEVCKSLNCIHVVDQICDRSLSVILWSSASKLCLVNAIAYSASKLSRQLPDSSTALFRHVRLVQALPHCLMQAHSLVNIGSVAALGTIVLLLSLIHI